MHKAAAHAKRGLPLRHLPAMDLPFLVLVLTLVGFGLVMLGSASSAVALYRRGDAFAYLRPQLLYAALGIGAMWVASRVDYHIYHKLAWPLLALSMVLLTAVLFMPEYNGCKRWLVLPGLGTLQPSEIAKFAVVLVFAHIIALNHDRMGSFAVGVLPFALVLGAVAVLMLLEPHLSGTVLILGIGAVLMFVGGTGLKWFVLAGAGGAAAIGAAIIIMPDLVPYAASRLSSWLDPFADPLGDGHQTIQSLYAIGSGGAAGLGLGSSRQKHLFVPEPQNDFIFSILCEELGFVGACAVILLFALLLTVEKLWLLPVLERRRWLGHIYVLVFVLFGFVLFDASGVSDAALTIRAMLGGGGLAAASAEAVYTLRSYAVVLLLAAAGATPLPKRAFDALGRTRFGARIMTVLEPLGLAVLLAVCTAFLVDGSFNPFLYFRF